MPELLDGGIAPLDLVSWKQVTIANDTDTEMFAADANYRYAITSIVTANNSATDGEFNFYEGGAAGTLFLTTHCIATCSFSVCFGRTPLILAKNKSISVKNVDSRDNVAITMVVAKLE